MKEISCPLHLNNSHHPKAIAFIFPQGNLTFQEVEQRVQAEQDFLIANGVSHGTRVGILSPHSPEYMILLLALWRIGGVACLLSPRSPKKEIQKQIRELNCLYTDPSLRGAFWATKQSQKTRLPRQSRHSFLAMTQMPLNTPATIMLTSGSSGAPKAVVHTIANHYFNARGSDENIPVKPGDRWLLFLPLYHVSGLSILWRCVLGGGAVVLPDESLSLQKNIQKFSITHVSLVTTQLIRFLKKKKNIKILKKLKAILLGGGPVPDELIQKCQRLKLPVYITYGLTEMASQVATSKKGGATPFLLPYREIKISADGEILVRGKTLFKGYLKNGKLVRPLDKQGWFRTGDLGSYDSKGGLKILGRKDNLFISGGENIYPEEIEQAILNTKLVEQAIVVPVKHHDFGARPVAYVNSLKNTISLKKALAKILPSFKIPDRFYALPKTTGLKLNRKELTRLI